MNRREFTLASATAIAVAQWPLNAAAQAISNLKMMIPANPGGGWDQTGRALGSGDAVGQGRCSRCSSTTRAARPARSASRSSSTAAKGDPNALMMGGMVMVGGIVLNKSPVDLTHGHADRAPDERVPGRRRAGELAVQDDGRPRRRRSRPIRARCPGTAARPAAPTTSWPA